MISFWSPAAGSFGIEQWIERRAPAMRERIEVRHYETLTAEPEIARGAHIFAGLDQLGPAGLAAVTALYHAVEHHCPGDRLLNNPQAAVGRFELLARCHAAGINQHRAWRAGDALHEVRYPVFVREDAGHDGALTCLLGSAREVSRGLRALRARGFRLAGLLVVEFCDLSDGDGEFTSAAACRVGDRIMPSHWLRGRHWVLKWDDSNHDRRALEEYRDYVLTDRYEAWQRRVFDLAGIDYGRLDFGVRGDTLRVWEINLNPTVGPGPGPPEPPLAPELEELLWAARNAYNRRVAEAFRALDPEARRDRVRLRLDRRLVQAMHAEQRDLERAGAALGFLRRIYHLPRLGRPLRRAYSLLWPRR